MHAPGESQGHGQAARAVAKTLPNLVLRTTFIVGFPGETDAEYGELLDFAKEQKFGWEFFLIRSNQERRLLV